MQKTKRKNDEATFDLKPLLLAGLILFIVFGTGLLELVTAIIGLIFGLFVAAIAVGFGLAAAIVAIVLALVMAVAAIGLSLFATFLPFLLIGYLLFRAVKR